MAQERALNRATIGIQVPKHMKRTCPDKAVSSPHGVHAIDKAKVQKGKQATRVVASFTNWRSKNKRDPHELEYKMLMGGLSYANL